ncbi:hypothetical protein EUZ69_12770 [Enterococcus faecalis]|uniref:hypothetical protein n=1 Tax=Enterococcus faecalis TaxID=1351 RepID=UPI0013D68EE4|nr:hypothetical protein [Enterococcus faecalis]NFA64817.1 hypothetical protein [Enterococcus faecalis]NFA95292.1 hypothetical protein [Enterococcus faecalis]
MRLKVKNGNKELFFSLLQELGLSIEKNKRITDISKERLLKMLELAESKVQKNNQSLELEAQVTYQNLNAYIILEKIRLAKNEVKILKELDRISHCKEV